MLSLFFYRHLQKLSILLAAGIVMGIVVFHSTIEIKDLDLWFHIRSGQYIFHHKTVPSVDVFSATAQGQYWNNHEWLFQVIVYGVKRLWGMDALIYMQAGIVALTFLLLFLLTLNRSRNFLIPPFLYIVYQMYQSRFTIRPDIFSLLFLVIFVGVLTKFLNRRWSLWLLLMVQILWVNIHGYFFIGILLPLIYLISEWLRRKLPLPFAWKQEAVLSKDEFHRLHWIVLAMIGAAFINPQGIQGALYPLLILGQMPSSEGKIFFKCITELQKPISLSSLWHFQNQLHYKVSIFLSSLILFFSFRRLEIRWVLMWLFFLFFSLIAVRNVPYFAVVSYFLMMFLVVKIDIEKISPIRFVSEKAMLLIGTLLMLSMCFVQIQQANDLSLLGYYDFQAYQRKSLWLGVDQRIFPHQAVDFLKTNRIQGNFLNDFNSGAYLIGRVYPRIKVFMDGRTELRGGKFFEHYRKVWDETQEKELDALLAKYNITGIFINTANQNPPKIFKVMFQKKDWYLVYLDYDGAIFLKDIPDNTRVIDEHTIDFTQWKPYDLDLIRFSSTRAVPYQFLHRAKFLYAVKMYDLALQECDAALQVYPAFAAIYALKGKIYQQRKDFDQAFAHYRLALSFEYSWEWYIALTKMYDEKGHYDEVIKRIEKIKNDAKMSAPVQLLLAKAYAKKNENAQAYDILIDALKKPLSDVSGLIDLADVFFHNQHFALAGKCFKIALKIKPYSRKAQRQLVKFFKYRKDNAAMRMMQKKLSKRVKKI